MCWGGGAGGGSEFQNSSHDRPKLVDTNGEEHIKNLQTLHYHQFMRIEIHLIAKKSVTDNSHLGVERSRSSDINESQYLNEYFHYKHISVLLL